MNDEIAIREDAPTSGAYGHLEEWAHAARAAHGVAQSLVRTSFVPEAFRGKPDEATAAILAGAEVGLSPMSALRSFDVIQGVAAPRAITLRAVALAAGHEIVVVESTRTRCVIKCRRRGSDDWQTVRWDIDRAKSLGLTGKHNWKAQPDAMLVARATSEAARLIAADAILGLNGGYAVEEIADVGTDGFAAPAPPKRTAKRAGVTTPSPAVPPPSAAPVAVDEPPLDDDPGPVDTDTGEIVDAEVVEDTLPVDETDMVTKAQMQMLGALMRQVGIEGRNDALEYVEGVIGRGITTRNELTKAEASTVIDALNALVGES